MTGHVVTSTFTVSVEDEFFLWDVISTECERRIKGLDRQIVVVAENAQRYILEKSLERLWDTVRVIPVDIHELSGHRTVVLVHVAAIASGG